MLCGHVADSFRFPMLIAASAAAHCGRLTAPPIVLCFALFSPLQKQQRRERKQEWQARAAAEFVLCDEQMDPAATTAMAATAAAAGSGGVGSVALGITAHGDAMAKAAMESHGDAMAKAAMAKAAMANVASDDAQADDAQADDAQADVDPDAARISLDTCLMDLLSRMDMKFDIGRKIASSRSGGRLHALASQTTDGGKQLRVEIDVHFGSSV